MKRIFKKSIIILTASVINSYAYSELVVSSAEYAMNVLFYINFSTPNKAQHIIEVNGTATSLN